jgi:hypothetical protein
MPTRLSVQAVVNILGGCLLAVGGCLLIVAGCTPEKQNPPPDPATNAEAVAMPPGKPGHMELVITPREPLSRDSLRFTAVVRNNTDKAYRWDKLWVAALFWEVEDLDPKDWIDYVSHRELTWKNAITKDSAEVYRARFVELLPGATMTSDMNPTAPHRIFHVGVHVDDDGEKPPRAVVTHYGIEVTSRFDIPAKTTSIEVGLVYTPGWPNRGVFRLPDPRAHAPPYTDDHQNRPFWTLYGFRPTEGGLYPSGVESNRVRIRFDGQNGAVIRDNP